MREEIRNLFLSLTVREDEDFHIKCFFFVKVIICDSKNYMRKVRGPSGHSGLGPDKEQFCEFVALSKRVQKSDFA